LGTFYLVLFYLVPISTTYREETFSKITGTFLSNLLLSLGKEVFEISSYVSDIVKHQLCQSLLFKGYLLLVLYLLYFPFLAIVSDIPLH
jgi:hypothetical protein